MLADNNFTGQSQSTEPAVIADNFTGQSTEAAIIANNNFTGQSQSTEAAKVASDSDPVVQVTNLSQSTGSLQ